MAKICVSQSQALEERLSNMHEQMAGVTSRLDRTERDLDLERATREDIIKAEVERRLAEAERRIREEMEAENASKREELDAREAALDKREKDMEQAFELMEQKVLADAKHQIDEARKSFEKSSLAKMAEQFDTFLQLFVSVVNGRRSDAEVLLAKYHTAAAEAKETLTREVQEKLDKAAQKGINKTNHIANLVRMLFTQKRERFMASDEERGTLYEQMTDSLAFTDEEKHQFKQLKDKLDAYRHLKEMERLARLDEKKKGHGRNTIPENIPLNGLSISKSTINDWHTDVSDIVKPLYDLQEERVFSDLYIAADGSPMPVVNSEKHRTVKQYVIGYRSISTGIPIFKTTSGKGSGRGKEVIKAQMAKWKGLALICDAYAGYDWIRKLGRVLCRCAAHARRDMERALKECPAKAKIGMLMYQEIYAVEDMIKHDRLIGADIIERRNSLARPLWENFRLWCMSEILEHDEHSLMHKALGYVIRHYDELTAYLDIAEMPLDNNGMERQLRAMVMGKQAYLFCQNEDSCERAAIMYSLIGACKVLGKNPEKWLTYVLKHIKTTKPEDLHKLLPEEWEEQ